MAKRTKEKAAEIAQVSRQKAKVRSVKAKQKAKTELDGFMDFVREQNVLGLAIGLVLGVQVKAVVDQIVASFINPILGLILPGAGGLAEKQFVLSVGAKQAVFEYGAFLSVMISFLTVALLIYFGVKTLRLDKLKKQS